MQSLTCYKCFFFQVTEKTDCCLDNLQAGFSLWEKLLLLAGEVECWSAQKLVLLAQSNPFQTEVDVCAMQVKHLFLLETVTFYLLRMLSIDPK